MPGQGVRRAEPGGLLASPRLVAKSVASLAEELRQLVMQTAKGIPLRFQDNLRNFGRDPLKDEREMGDAEADLPEAPCRDPLQNRKG